MSVNERSANSVIPPETLQDSGDRDVGDSGIVSESNEAAAESSDASRLSHELTFGSLDARKVYLEAIGLQRDPFATPVAEQELALLVYQSPKRGELAGEAGGAATLFSYYTPPAISLGEGRTILQELRCARPAYIYGRPGTGKTTLRLILEAECRSVPDQTLVVSYDMAKDKVAPLTLEEHCHRLARELAVDLFIQVVEQFNPRNPSPSPEQINALAGQLLVGGRPLRRLAERILSEPEPESQLGLSLFWPAAGRTAVRFVARSQALLDLVSACLSASSSLPFREMTGEAMFVAGVQAANTWGFERIFLLVDGVDARRRDAAGMLALLTPLLEKQRAWQEQDIVLKWFLPYELARVLPGEKGRLRRFLLSANPFSVIIKWDESSLRALLRNRFRAAGSRRLGFDGLAGQGLEGQLDNLILTAAQGSPRHLLQVVSALIDVHAARDPHDPLISLADWSNVYERRGYHLPSPVEEGRT